MPIALTPELRETLYNAFDPFSPLEVGDKRYVDCKSVRGDQDIIADLGNRIILSRLNTCYLYSGHRGAGKSTELLRLKRHLEENQFYVVFFDADAEDIQSADTQYTDILLACTRHLLESLQERGNSQKIVKWVKSRWQELGELLATELSFDKLSIEGQISDLVKITSTMKADPTLRQEVRKKLDTRTPELIDILNEYLNNAKTKLPDDKTKIALIVDSLDRIGRVIQEDGRSNFEHIFIDNASKLKALDCHLIYTTPIDLLYSGNATRIRNDYNGDPLILPMIMVRKPQVDHPGELGVVYEEGLALLKEIIQKRLPDFLQNIDLALSFFESEPVLEGLCLMSGGYVRNFLFLMQDVLNYSTELPIGEGVVKKVLSSNRATYKQTIQEGQYELLAYVAYHKQIKQTDEYRKLLFNNCVLEYRYWDEEKEIQKWYDVHPLIRGISEFKVALNVLQSGN